MTRLAVLFLVLLRLAIGWHFLAEGAQKIPPKYYVWAGLQPVSKPFSSAGYFRAAPGPLGKGVPLLSGDAEEEALSLLVPLPIARGADPATDKPQERVPPGLNKAWQEYLKRFIAFHKLDEGQRQRAEAVLEQSKARVVLWLEYMPPADLAVRETDKLYPENTSEQTRHYTSGEVKRRMSMAERVAEYRTKIADIRDTTERKLWLFGKDVEGARLRSAQAEVAGLRQGLLSDLDKQTKAYKESLDKLLTKEQKDEGQLTLQPETTPVGYVDLVTPWALTAIGACLLLGLFSRLSAFLGAGFLLLTCLAIPALPWLPAPMMSEGSYLFVNKNVIEMLALLVLASLPTGRWFGADGILYAIGGLFRGKKAGPAS
jgi:uncharacterized membrane protein YphA (DoxX/SURF4 family)